jgi:hypothetical protein
MCDLTQNGSTKAPDVRALVNQALGVTAALNDLTGVGAVSVADVQIEINAVLGLGCAAR